MSNITQMLDAIERGERQAAEELLPVVYEELRRQAALQMAQEKSGQTLQATALVHEAYLRLVGKANAQGYQNRRHFYAAAAEAMRRILIERARRIKTEKHGGNRRREGMIELAAIDPVHPADLLALDEALDQLKQVSPQKAELVRLRYFGGCSLPEIAEMLGISLPTAERYWAYAKAWLYQALSDDEKQTED